MSKSSNVAVVVSLSDSEIIQIAGMVPGDQSVIDKMGKLASALLRDVARGGGVIPPDWAARIRAAIGTVDPQAVTEAVEKSVGRDGEAPRVEWTPDPTQMSFYQMLADNCGVTLNHQLKSLMDYAYSQGWFGMGTVDAFKLLVSQEEYQWLQKLFQKDNVTGRDVIEALAKGGNAQAQDGDDVVLAALRGE